MYPILKKLKEVNSELENDYTNNKYKMKLEL